jgi:hypothetical protein
MKKYSLIIYFVLALAVRIGYAAISPNIIYGPDSSGYYGIGKEMFAHPALNTIIHPYRTPLYPFFVNAVFYSLGIGGTAEDSPVFNQGLQAIVVIQMILGAGAFALFAASINPWIALVLVFDVFTLGWERAVLTEGIAVSLVLVVTAVLMRTLASPTTRKFILLFILFSLGFLLRPALLTLPVAVLPILAWHFRKKSKVVLSCVVTLVSFLLVPLLYMQLNRIGTGYTGIQIVGDIDILGRILETRLPVESARGTGYFYDTVKDYETKNLTYHPFRFLEYYDPGIYQKTYRFNELHRFNQTVILHELPQFLTNMITNVPEVLLEVNAYTWAPPGSKAVQYVTLIVPFLWVITLIQWLAHPTRDRTLIALLGTMVMSQVLLTAAVVYKDEGGQYQRLLSVIRPQMFLFIILSLQLFFYPRAKHKEFRDTDR